MRFDAREQELNSRIPNGEAIGLHKTVSLSQNVVSLFSLSRSLQITKCVFQTTCDNLQKRSDVTFVRLPESF